MESGKQAVGGGREILYLPSRVLKLHREGNSRVMVVTRLLPASWTYVEVETDYIGEAPSVVVLRVYPVRR